MTNRRSIETTCTQKQALEEAMARASRSNVVFMDDPHQWGDWARLIKKLRRMGFERQAQRLELMVRTLPLDRPLAVSERDPEQSDFDRVTPMYVKDDATPRSRAGPIE